MTRNSPTPDAETLIAEGIASRSEALQHLVQDLRAYLKRETRPAYELGATSTQSFNLGYGFTPKAWDCYCAIIVYRSHLNLSFPSGAHLADPDHLLQGTGSRIRHLKIQDLGDLQVEAAQTLLRSAREHSLYQLRDEAIDPNPESIITRVRAPKP